MHTPRRIITIFPRCILAIAGSLFVAGCNSDTQERFESPPVTVQAVSDPIPAIVPDDQCEGDFRPEQITDLILATGQSNLLGPQTQVAATLDGFGKVLQFDEPDLPHPRVFAWTVDPRTNAGQGWQVAQLTQSWHNSSPGVAGLANNNFAFHFAKQVATQSSGCRILGIMMVAEGGRGISHWDDGAEGWQQVTQRVSQALAAIGRSEIDGVLWHQGESDWIVDGTCYPGDSCRTGMPDYYPQKFYSQTTDPDISNPVGNQALIDRLRRQPWFSNQKPFIAAETLRAPINVHLNKLNTDNDPWTATVRGDLESGLEANPTDPFINHYSGDALRQLGQRYGREYIQMKGL